MVGETWPMQQYGPRDNVVHEVIWRTYECITFFFKNQKMKHLVKASYTYIVSVMPLTYLLIKYKGDTVDNKFELITCSKNIYVMSIIRYMITRLLYG